MRKCYRCLSALARRGLIAQAARARRRQDFRQSPPPGQALEMSSCNIAAAKVDLQGSVAIGGSDNSRGRRANADRRAVLGACLPPARERHPDEAQAQQRPGVPPRLDQSFRHELLVGCRNRSSRSVDAVLDLRLQCFINLPRPIWLMAALSCL